MKFPQTTEYALRAAAHLATLPDGETVRSEALADATNVPLAYLSKVLRRLVDAEVLAVRKGPGGGYALARAPEAIRFSEILAAIDGPPETDMCAFGFGRCDRQAPCALHGAWSELKDSIHQWAEHTTLAEVRAFAAARPTRRRRVRVIAGGRS